MGPCRPRAAGTNAKYSFQNYPRFLFLPPLTRSLARRIGSDCTCPCTFLKAKKETTTSVKLRREGGREGGGEGGLVRLPHHGL